jgi:hypothetical protein
MSPSPSKARPGGCSTCRGTWEAQKLAHYAPLLRRVAEQGRLRLAVIPEAAWPALRGRAERRRLPYVRVPISDARAGVFSAAVTTGVELSPAEAEANLRRALAVADAGPRRVTGAYRWAARPLSRRGGHRQRGRPIEDVRAPLLEARA